MTDPKFSVFINGATGKVMLEVSQLGETSVITSIALPVVSARRIGEQLIAEAGKAKTPKAAG